MKKKMKIICDGSFAGSGCETCRHAVPHEHTDDCDYATCYTKGCYGDGRLRDVQCINAHPSLALATTTPNQLQTDGKQDPQKIAAVLLLLIKHLQAMMFSEDARKLAYMDAAEEAQTMELEDAFQYVLPRLTDLGKQERDDNPMSCLF